MRDRWRRRGVLAAGAAALLPSSGIARAGTLPAPTGKVILTVGGNIANVNDGGKAKLDRRMLEAIGLVDLVTSTPHTEGTPTWRGVRLWDLFRYLGASGTRLRAVALDGYSVEITLAEVEGYDLVLALDRDGKPMRVRDKGPAWLIFPWDRYPELDNDVTAGQSIWQVSELWLE